jgi:hypothetical protein
MFADEHGAKDCLFRLLKPYFTLQKEVWLRHWQAGTPSAELLRIDFLAKPDPRLTTPPHAGLRTAEDFPFPWFGIEVKKGYRRGGDYTKAVTQAEDYTHCTIEDKRPTLQRIYGRRIERVYLFPALDDDCKPEGEHAKGEHSVYWLNRRIGIKHVGLIYRKQVADLDYPSFVMCADRQWCARFGARRAPHKIHQTVGSGQLRKDAEPEAPGTEPPT